MSVVTTTEAADLVGVAPFTVRQWVARGHLLPLRPDAKPLRFREMDVIECAAARMPKARHDELDAVWAQVLAAEAPICHDRGTATSP